MKIINSNVNPKYVTIMSYLDELEEENNIENIIDNLKKQPKRISSKYFYDENGSRLFEQITQLDEYYQTATEMEIIRETCKKLQNDIAGCDIVEIGSGDCSKISEFLGCLPRENQHKVRYIPFDISHAAIEQASENLLSQFTELKILGIIGDFNAQLHLIPDDNTRLFCFFGSTLGNLTEEQIEGFFREIDGIMHYNEVFLLGIDRIKDIEVLERAYNDSNGITEKFNKNILNVINTILESDFNPDNFDHMAFYNKNKQRIEMHLRSRDVQIIHSPYLKNSLKIEKDDMIHTENSHKFSIKMIEDYLEDTDLQITDSFSDKREWFSLLQIEKRER